MKAYIVFYDEANYYIAEAASEAEAAAEAEATLGTGWQYVEELSAEAASSYAPQES